MDIFGSSQQIHLTKLHKRNGSRTLVTLDDLSHTGTFGTILSVSFRPVQYKSVVGVLVWIYDLKIRPFK